MHEQAASTNGHGSSSSPEDRSLLIERARYHSSNHGRHDLPDASCRCIILGGRDTMAVAVRPRRVRVCGTIRCAHIHVTEMSSTVCSCQYVTIHKGCSQSNGGTNERDRGVIFFQFQGSRCCRSSLVSCFSILIACLRFNPAVSMRH